MILFSVITTLVSVCFAVVVLGYTSLATPVGPWIEPVVALFLLLLVRVLYAKSSSEKMQKGLRIAGLATVAAGMGGAIATSFGFFFPTFYFLDRPLFEIWMANPLQLMLVSAGITFSAGGFAFLVVQYIESGMLADPKTPFPVGQAVSRLLTVGDGIKKSVMLLSGFCGTIALSFILWFWRLVPQALSLFSGASFSVFRIPAISIQVDLLWMFVGIGFIAGSLLVLPLLVGLFSKILLLGPLHLLFFKQFEFKTFLFAFAGGIMLQEAVLSMVKLPKLFGSVSRSLRSWWGRGRTGRAFSVSRALLVQSLLACAVLAGTIVYFSWFGFSVTSQLYLYLFTLICVQQIAVIGGKSGMAPLGRYATFVMLPGLFLFSYSPLQATLVSLFVGLAGIVTVDLLFGRVIGRQLGLERKTVILFQLLGLIISAILIGFVLWKLVLAFGLGSPALFAQRAQARALLINAGQFDPIVLLLGAIFGFVLNRLSISPLLVFTGLIFPEQYSLILIVGGLIAWCTRDRDNWEPFWSGVFAAGSIWMLIKAMV